MEYTLQQKIYGLPKQAQYLKEHSQWYKYLNRSPEHYKQFLEAYKKYGRGEQTKKLNGAIDTLDTVNTIFKFMN